MKKHILVVLPELSEDVVEKVKETLRELGVESEKELRFVVEKDLTADGVLSKIKARKLIAAWAECETVFGFTKAVFKHEKLCAVSVVI